MSSLPFHPNQSSFKLFLRVAALPPPFPNVPPRRLHLLLLLRHPLQTPSAQQISGLSCYPSPSLVPYPSPSPLVFVRFAPPPPFLPDFSASAISKIRLPWSSLATPRLRRMSHAYSDLAVLSPFYCPASFLRAKSRPRGTDPFHRPPSPSEFVPIPRTRDYCLYESADRISKAFHLRTFFF